jgi:hypothetical protein
MNCSISEEFSEFGSVVGPEMRGVESAESERRGLTSSGAPTTRLNDVKICYKNFAKRMLTLEVEETFQVLESSSQRS